MKHVKAWKKIEAKLCPALIFSSFIFKFLRNLVGACKITFQGKVQKHQALEAEVAANEDRVTSVLNVGRGKVNDVFTSFFEIHQAVDCRKSINGSIKLKTN